MRALSWDGTRATVIEREEPAPTPGYALVRMTRAGICNTDLEIAKGYMSFRGVLGHELVGVVEDGPDAWRGKRVVAEINFACGTCADCQAGLGRHCPARTVMGILGADGAFADLVSVPIANLHAVPDAIDDDHAVFAEPLAAAFEILDQVSIARGTRCVVLGDGKLGLLVAQVLALAGGDVLAVGKHQEKLALLSGRGIATTTFDAWTSRPLERAAVVVEATGSAKGFAAAVAATKPRGTLVLKSTVADDVPLSLASIVIHEISVVGSRCGRFEPALDALAAASIDVTPLISARRPLARADEALRLAAAPGTLKVLLEPG
jgi:threonine dehydrogenase-like Zn-dependent dehydrogenase